MSVKSTNKSSGIPPDALERLTAADALTDADIDAAIVEDADWAAAEPIDWSKAEVAIPPKKQAISIRLDEDLIAFFKAEGPGYQRRINAVLRSYIGLRRGGG
jgi:uncharacterized protein (DUF4415 family)